MCHIIHEQTNITNTWLLSCLMFWYVNNLHGGVILQRLPEDSFKWRK